MKGRGRLSFTDLFRLRDIDNESCVHGVSVVGFQAAF